MSKEILANLKSLSLDISEDSLKTIRTSLTYDECMTEHFCPWDPNYPECPERFSLSLKRCVELGLVDRCKFIPPRSATEKEIFLLHDKKHLDLIKTTDGNEDLEKLESFSSLYDSIYFNSKTYQCALKAVGCAIDLVDNVVSGETQNGMAIIRPPGHHAMTSEFCGYCFFNNVAIAAKHALDDLKLKKILIVDYDIHHGQATQYSFYDDPRVLYFSIHRYEHGSFWPELRESNFDHIGAGPGKGFNINVPLNSIGLGNNDFMAIFHQILLPVAYEFNPELILVSSGFDAALGCPEGEMLVTPAFYSHMLHSLMGLAQGKICVFLEGGYFLKSLAEGVAMSLRCLLGDPCPRIGPLEGPSESVQDTILSVISHLRPYWRSLAFQGSYSKSDVKIDNRHKHIPKIEYKGQLGLKRPDTFPTKDYYYKHSEAKMIELSKIVDDLIVKTNLFVPKNRLCLAFDPFMAKHQSILEKVHPEKPERILKIYEKLKTLGYPDRCLKLPSRHATEEELSMVHGENYVELMRNTQFSANSALLELQENYKSIYFCKDSYNAATLATGFLFQAVDSVAMDISRSGVAVVRPPGHHAEKEEACGFCIFNNVALAAKYAQTRYSLNRILIVDWDVHHGNGTQQLFEDDPRFLYISIHRYDNSLFFPFLYTADSNFTGKGEGEGFNVNVPWNKGRMGDGDYLAAFFQIVMPIAYEFDPDMVFISSGFDAARGDLIGGCVLSPEIYSHMTHQLCSLANGKVILALEGGYNVPVIASCMANCVGALLGDPLPALIDDLKPCDSAVLSILKTKRAHAKYWKSLKFDVDLPSFSYIKPESRGSPDAFEVNNVPFKREIPSNDEIGATGGSNSKAIEILIGNQVPSQLYAVEPLPWCPHLENGVGKIPLKGLDPKNPCSVCNDVTENWVCTKCFHVACGRYVEKHMMEHYKEQDHPLALSFSDFSVWCYTCDSYLDNPILDPIKEEAHLKKFGVSRSAIE